MPKSFEYDAAGYPLFPCGSNDKMFSPTDLNRMQQIFEDCLAECGLSARCLRVPNWQSRWGAQ